MVSSCETVPPDPTLGRKVSILARPKSRIFACPRGVTKRCDEYVRGLDVAVHDALRVCRFQGVSNLDGEAKQLVDFKWVLTDH
jgi:hypothetical protein